MFGFGRRYYVVEERNNNGCLYGCLFGLIIIVALIAALIAFAWYALLVLVGLLVVAGAIIGIFYSVKNNVKAYSDSYNTNRYYNRPNTSKPVNLALRALLVCKDHMVYAWKANSASIKDLFAKAETYRFLSFQKWMYLFACLSVAVWGVIISFFILNVYIQVLVWAAMGVLAVTAIICAIPIIIAIPLAIWQFIKNYVYIFRSIWRSYHQTPGTSVYIYNKGYKHIVSVFKNTFRKDVFDAKDKLRVGSTFKWLSFKRWIPHCTAVLLVGLGTILQIPLFILHVIVLSIAIVFYSIGIGFFFVVDAILALFANKSATCPNIRCNNKLKRNVYVCDCGEPFKKLHPSTRGIFKRKCSCGRMVPSTIFSGKHKMKDLCPKCGFRITR